MVIFNSYVKLPEGTFVRHIDSELSHLRTPARKKSTLPRPVLHGQPTKDAQMRGLQAVLMGGGLSRQFPCLAVAKSCRSYQMPGIFGLDLTETAQLILVARGKRTKGARFPEELTFCCGLISAGKRMRNVWHVEPSLGA